MKTLKHGALGVLAVLTLALLVGKPAHALEVGEVAPCVVLQGIGSDGEAAEGCIREPEAESQGFTLIEFFLTLCEDCQLNLPIVSKLAGEIKATTTVRLVALDREQADVEQYIKEKADLINFPVAYDLERDAKRAYGVFLTPTLFLLNAETNEVLYKHTGVLTDADVAELKTLVGGNEPPPPPPVELNVGDVAPCVVLPGLTSAGEKAEGCIRNQEVESQGFTILKFASITCATCNASLPKMSGIANRLGKLATTRLVYVDPDVAEVNEYLATKGELVNFAVAYDTERDAAKAYGLKKTPLMFILDKENKVVYKHAGALSPEDIMEIAKTVGAGQGGGEPGELKVGDIAPCVVLPGLNSQKQAVEGCIRNQEVESQKFTILEFASITCAGCERNLPKLSAAAKRLKKLATTRLVYLDPDVTEVKSYIEEKGQLIHFPVAFDADHDAKKAYGVKKTPTLFILDKENKVVYKHQGVLGPDDVKKIAETVGAGQGGGGIGHITVGDTAPCVVLPGIDSVGDPVEGCIRKPENRQQKFTILEFMSIDCGACLRNLPSVMRLADDVYKNATVRLVSVDENVRRVKQFIWYNRIFLPTAFDSKLDAAKAYGLRATPTLFILNSENKVVYKHVGVLTQSDIRRIRGIVASSPL